MADIGYLKDIMSCKLNLMNMLLNSQDVIDLINNSESDDLSETNIFMHPFIPDTNTIATTFIWFDITVPRIQNGLIKEISLRIDIFSHKEVIRTGMGYTRVDKLQSVIDEMLNGHQNFGIDEIVLISNPLLIVNDKYVGKSLYYSGLSFNRNLLKGTLEYDRKSQ